ncbi:unnamed protein product [Acanthoscelides obtectus]|uniref:Uncharacterized protein n=1 Tax=Acanthoscelides obtectus TaxID=200917 RepID=A0A9P0M965_ACAOB|nr:unnamed protein product [Acanthoscelides obtectus]CAK1682491.1 hypothetical protein AOBTE_LOCUS33671 [Acanthoscelides obtectus]
MISITFASNHFSNIDTLIKRFKMAGQWRSNEDFEQDLNMFSEMSEIQDNSDEDEPTLPPQTVLEYQARQHQSNQSIFTDNFMHEEGVVYVYSGRGRGVASQIFAPGLKTSNTPSDEEDIKRRIRQEVGHVGYDEMLYSKYKRLNNKPDESLLVNATESNHSVQLDCSTSQPSSSRTSPQIQSSCSSVICLQPHSDVSRSSTPTNFSVKSSTSSTKSSPKKVISVPQIDEKMTIRESENDEQTKPLPLSVIMRKAKKKSVEKDKNEQSPPKKSQSIQNLQSTMPNGKENGNLAANQPCASSTVKEFCLGSSTNALKSSSSSDSIYDPWWRSNGPDNWRDKTTCSPRFFKGNTSSPWRKKPTYDLDSDKEFPPL